MVAPGSVTGEGLDIIVLLRGIALRTTQLAAGRWGLQILIPGAGLPFKENQNGI
jgi:hypothetical protein